MFWWRFYTEMPRDRKIRRLKPEHRWLWCCVLTAARESPVPGCLLVSENEAYDLADLADLAGMTEPSVKRGLRHMHELNLIETDDAGTWHVPAFMQRQFPSDSSTDRTRAYRRNNGRPSQ